MTVIQKLSDRDNLIFEAIKLVLVNEGNLTPKQIQYKLFECGIFINGNLLKQALSVMDQKGLLTKPSDISKELKQDLKEKAKIIQDVFQKEKS